MVREWSIFWPAGMQDRRRKRSLGQACRANGSYYGSTYDPVKAIVFESVQEKFFIFYCSLENVYSSGKEIVGQEID
jgi:hypothetical protein